MPKANSNKQRKRPEEFHYWPADRVPLLPISYCQLIQGIFAVLMLSSIGYVVFGLK